MKPEEAIEIMSEALYRTNNPVSAEAIHLSIQALEKQVAKKPERLNAFKSIGKCRGCEKVISTRTASAYCQYCGNKVDWGNED